jgi:hypothetical protein
MFIGPAFWDSKVLSGERMANEVVTRDEKLWGEEKERIQSSLYIHRGSGPEPPTNTKI